jgi:hypothetical protein
MLNNAFPAKDGKIENLYKDFAHKNKINLNWHKFKYIFKPHDYENKKPETHVLYEKFHKYIVNNLSKFKSIANQYYLMCLVRYDNYLTDFNSVKKATVESIKKQYNDIINI